MKSFIYLSILLAILSSCTDKKQETAVLNEMVSSELDNFISLLEKNDLKDDSFLCFSFYKNADKVNFDITLNPIFECSNFEGVFYYGQEPVFISFEGENNVSLEDIKPAIKIVDSEKLNTTLREICLKINSVSPEYSGYDPPVWTYEINENNITLVHESGLKRE
ncbi:hypothetical protein [Sinomicrobium sp.]